MKCFHFKRRRVIPENKKLNHSNNFLDERNHTHNFLDERNHTHNFLDEVLLCGTCKKAFSLKQNELSAICGGCNQFLHCGIAGKCVGPNCGNSVHRLSWCIKCVPKTILINLYDLGPDKDCLCQECLDDPLTPSYHKRKL